MGSWAGTRRWYPRRYCLGLIEAHSEDASKKPIYLYPRRYCLGLIEALIQISQHGTAVLGIRGVIASASLKRSLATLLIGITA